MPTLILIAGPNGAGKMTFATEILTTDLNGVRFINADEIARGLSPFNPAAVAFKAGRILIQETAGLIAAGTSQATGMRRPWKAPDGLASRDSFSLASQPSGVHRLYPRPGKDGWPFRSRQRHPPPLSPRDAKSRPSLSPSQRRVVFLGCPRFSSPALGKFLFSYYSRHRSNLEHPMITPAYKLLKPMKLHELPEEGQVALRAMRRAARKLRLEHRRLGLPIIVWEKGRIVEKKA